MMVARSAYQPAAGSASVRSDPGLSVFATCEALLSESMDLMEKDTESVDALMLALALPKNTAALEAARAEAVGAALVGAIEPQTGILQIASHLVGLMEVLVPLVAPGIRADLAAAAEVTRSAVAIALLNVEANNALIADSGQRRDFLEAIAIGESAVARAQSLVERMTRIVK